MLPDPFATRKLHKRLLANMCQHYQAPTLEFLLAAHPPILDHVLIGDVLRTHVPTDARILELLALRFGSVRVTDMLQWLAGLTYFVPSVIEWCMKQGMRFDAHFFHRMMVRAASERDVSHMEHLLRLGGTWRAEYFRMALIRDHLTFCQ